MEKQTCGLVEIDNQLTINKPQDRGCSQCKEYTTCTILKLIHS